MDPFDLLTVRQAAAELFTSEQAVRRLVKTGKLEALKEGGRLLIKRESLRAYIAAQPHPPVYMSAMHTARTMLGLWKATGRDQLFLRWRGKTTIGADPFDKHMERLKPHLEGLLEALKVKDYGKADEARRAMWREHVDYEMLHKTIKPGEVRQRPPKPEWVMDMLFEDDALN